MNFDDGSNVSMINMTDLPRSKGRKPIVTHADSNIGYDGGTALPTNTEDE